MVDNQVVRIAQPELSAAEGPFAIFMIHEKVLIHHADSLDVILRHEHRRARDNVQVRLNLPQVGSYFGRLSMPQRPSTPQQRLVFEAAP